MSVEPLAVRARLALVPNPARYLVVGALSFAVDYQTLVLVRHVFEAPLWLATTSGFWVSFLLNFALSRLWTFQDSNGHPAGQLVRYAALVAVNFTVTLVAVSVLHGLGLSLLLAKAATVGTLTVTTFLAYKHWVFRD